MTHLGVNIDHVATLRQARRQRDPDPIAAAHYAGLAGAEIITVHLREDRRHINDDDVKRLAASLPSGLRLNLEMAATSEMLSLAIALRKSAGAPHMVTLVPEKRQELTTEGGLNLTANQDRMKKAVARLKAAPGGITVSAFITPDQRHIEAARKLGFDACEFHTGPWAHAYELAGGDLGLPGPAEELTRLAVAGDLAVQAGMRFHAGHALNYNNVRPIAALGNLSELHIGHAIICRAVFTGLQSAVAEMKRLIESPGRERDESIDDLPF